MPGTWAQGAEASTGPQADARRRPSRGGARGAGAGEIGNSSEPVPVPRARRTLVSRGRAFGAPAVAAGPGAKWENKNKETCSQGTARLNTFSLACC